LLSNSRPADARAHYDAVLSDGTATAIPDLAWRAAFGRGRSFEAAGTLDQALQDYLRAVNTIELVRSQLESERSRTGFLDDKREVYVALVRLLLRMGRTREAFQAAERLRAEGYRELLRSSVALGAASDAIPASLLSRITQLQTAIDAELRRPSAEQRGEAVTVYREELRDAEQGWASPVAGLTARGALARGPRPGGPG